MSLVVVVKGPEGVVLAADTRITVTRRAPGGQFREVNFDNASKILTFGKQHSHVAAVAYGPTMIGGRPVHTLMPEFQWQLGIQSRKVVDYARELGEFLKGRWVDSGAPGNGPILIVAGIDEEIPQGEIDRLYLPDAATPVEQAPNSFGMSWGGQLDGFAYSTRV